jgi:hypothetical protein
MNKNASDSDGDTGNESSVEESGINQGPGTQDASGDVTLGSCREGFSHEIVEGKVTIHNTSYGTSDYYIEGQALRGGVVIGGLINASVSSVPGGGTAGRLIRCSGRTLGQRPHHHSPADSVLSRRAVQGTHDPRVRRRTDVETVAADLGHCGTSTA